MKYRRREGIKRLKDREQENEKETMKENIMQNISSSGIAYSSSRESILPVSLSLSVCGHCKQGQSFTKQHAPPLLWR
jgi:hypothetical protein